MSSDFEIGRVIAVDTAQVTIELTSDVKAQTRTTYEGAQEVGRINSYVIIPVGARNLVAMVTRVMLVNEAEMTSDRTMVTLPRARRLVKATLIGTIDNETYGQGVAVFPILDNPVHLATSKDLSIIFDCRNENETVKPHQPGFCIRLGDSPVFEGFPIKVDPDAFFGKHAAVLGSTGSGKSCTIASLLQSILAHPQVQHPHFIILDTNGEYRSAFQETVSGKSEDAGQGCLYLPSDPTKTEDRLTIPYWFMNAEDFVRLFAASQGVQRPVLLEALRLARNEASEKSSFVILKEELIRVLNRLLAVTEKDGNTSKELRDEADGLINRLKQSDVDKGWSELGKLSSKLEKDKVLAVVETVKAEAAKRIEKGTFPQSIPSDVRKTILEAIDPLLTELSRTMSTEGETQSHRISADTPAFFDKQRFRVRDIEQVLKRPESGGARARDHSGTMLLRIDRLLADRRFEFLLGPMAGQFPKAEHSLATFIRDILGLPSAKNLSPSLSGEAVVPKKALPFYDRQRAGSGGHKVVVLDLSLLAAEVLENVTALIGRLMLEFLQRLGEVGGEDARGSLPVVLVLEEAQNYIGTKQHSTEPAISQVVFERIAREGRKYGLSLVVASQRPSELSKTVLSQCSSFVVHRLQNPEDLRYFKEIVPGIYGPLLDQLPALAPQTALVMGECVRAPAIVRIREARPVPRSKDPKFFAHWAQDAPVSVDVEKVCAIWEEKSPDEPGTAKLGQIKSGKVVKSPSPKQ